MAFKMIYICSCGQSWDMSEWTDVEAHMEANVTHTISEGYSHTSSSGVPDQVPVKAADGTIFRLGVDTSGGVSSASDSGIATKLPKSVLDASTDPNADDDSSEGYEVGSRWVNATSGEEFVCFDNTNGAAVWGSTTSSGAGMWGSDAIMAESIPVSVTTYSSKWGTKVTLNATASATGTYRIAWNYGWNYDSTSYDFNARLLEDGVAIWYHVQEPKDSGGTGSDDWKSTGTDQRFNNSGFIYRDLNLGAHTYTLEWKAGANGNEASIWDATLEFWRHS